MKTNVEKYKNIDKSTQFLFNELTTFKVIHLKNLSSENEFIKHHLTKNFIQIYFCLSSNCTIAINFEHCAISLSEGNSNMVYFKDEQMNVLYNLQPKSEIVAILISLEYFHSLFSTEGDLLFNFNNFKTGKPIIEPKETSTMVKTILNQLISNKTNESLRPIYIKGKVYELLSYYFSTSTESENENCPYIANEETIGKIKKAKQIILEEMNNPPSLAELAKRVGLNIKKLKTDFKEFYGVPVFSFLLNYKMELAKTMLQEQHLNVNEIAMNLGYSASSHFIAAFKRKFGVTPKQFAKS